MSVAAFFGLGHYWCMKQQSLLSLNKGIVHPLRTTLGAVLAFLLAKLVGLPEVYWAPISAIVVMESTLGATFTFSYRRLIGTALGSVAGALLLSHFEMSLLAYAGGIFILGLFCATLRLEKSAYRFAGVTRTVIMFVSHTNSAWIVAFHRFIEISLGIIVSLILTALWPEKEMQKK